jgi:hypothetical protein
MSWHCLTAFPMSNHDSEATFCVVLNHITSQKWCQNFDLRSIRLSNRPHFYSFLTAVFRICLLVTPRPLKFKISSDGNFFWRGQCIKNSCLYALSLSEFLFLTPDINIQGSRNRENSVRPERSVHQLPDIRGFWCHFSDFWPRHYSLLCLVGL